MKSVQIQIIGCLLGGKEGMFLSPQSKVAKLLLPLKDFVVIIIFILVKTRIPGNLFLNIYGFT